MRVIVLLNIIFASILFSAPVNGQVIDSTYIETYAQRIRLTGFVGTDFIQIHEGKSTYTPNYPLTPGIGIAVKNTVINVRLGYGLLPLNSKDKHGETKSIDLQMHNYWRNFMFDLSLQRYQGFFDQDRRGNVRGVYPDMTVLQAGGELTYIFNGSKFSARAAFDQTEKQLKSAGSFLAGGEAFFYRVNMDKNTPAMDAERSDNLQVGIKAGYGHSWVLGEHWLLSVVGMAGMNFGNEPEALKNWKVKFYPTGTGRFGSSYHRDNWAVGMAVLIGNKQIYNPASSDFNLTSTSMQISYVLYVDKLFRR